MERQIKFRGKAIKNTFSINEKEAKIKIGDWVYGAVIPFDDGIDLIYEREPNNPKICGCHGIDVDQNTVGQYTGLNDKNGKEIYEGDILKNNFSDVPFGVVTWHKDGYFFIDCGFGKFPINANGYRPLGEMLVLKLDNVKDVTFEVIGNIHDK